MRKFMFAMLIPVLALSSCKKAEIMISDPIAAFETNIVPGKEASENDIIQFTNQSSEGTYFWDFGNGETSTAKDPEASYRIHGSYTVSLKVTDKNGASVTTSEKLIVLCKFAGGIHTSTE